LSARLLLVVRLVHHPTVVMALQGIIPKWTFRQVKPTQGKSF
jgi:hypothetical protein|tara:strand:- start:545 stop:670 length:126 start_codon:yes stop_codon:yes gene_type:complete